MTLIRLTAEELAVANAGDALGATRDTQRRRLTVLGRYELEHPHGSKVSPWEIAGCLCNKDWGPLAEFGLIERGYDTRWRITELGLAVLAAEQVLA